MTVTRRSNRQLGLTIIELLVVVATLGLLVSLLLPRGTKCYKGMAPLTACVNNLKQVALSELVWAYDHDSTNIFLAQVSTNAGGFRELLSPGSLPHFFRALSNELVSPRILTCPSDGRKPGEDFASLTANHLSYFLNMDARPNAEAVIHGDRHITFNPAAHGKLVTVTTNLSLGWTKKTGHESVGNLAIADGSVLKTTDRDLTEYLIAPSRQTVQRLLFP